MRATPTSDAGIALLQPVSCGCDGPPPQIGRLPTLRDEAARWPNFWATPTRLMATTEATYMTIISPATTPR